MNTVFVQESPRLANTQDWCQRLQRAGIDAILD